MNILVVLNINICSSFLFFDGNKSRYLSFWNNCNMAKMTTTKCKKTMYNILDFEVTRLKGGKKNYFVFNGTHLLPRGRISSTKASGVYD